MSAPIETYGHVSIFAPTGTGRNGVYHVLRWSKVDGTPGKTTGGRTLEQARWKAYDICTYESSAAGPLAVTRFDVLVDKFLAAGRNQDGTPWKENQRSQMTRNLKRCLRVVKEHRAMDVDRVLLDLMRAQAGTVNMVRQNTNNLRAVLRFGYENGYLTAEQSELLPRGGVRPAPALKGRKATPRRRRGRVAGDGKAFVRDEDAPSRAQVVALCRALRRRFGWGELAVELAAACGARWGEQFQLRTIDIHLDGCGEFAGAHLHIDAQVDGGASARNENGRRCLPKGDKTRTVGIPETTFTGYRLQDELRTWIAVVERDHEETANRDGLIFPAPKGGLWWHTGFINDVLLPAMEEAGWPIDHWEDKVNVWLEDEEEYLLVNRECRQAVLTWHSLRHRFARFLVDVKKLPPAQLMAMGGWDNIATVQNRYYASGHEHVQDGIALMQ